MSRDTAILTTSSSPVLLVIMADRQYIHLQHLSDFNKHYGDLIALLDQNIKVHFIALSHQNTCGERANFILATSGSHPSAQIVTINESKLLRDNLTAFVNVYHAQIANDIGDDDDDDDSDGPTSASDQTCPCCGIDPELAFGA